jgi:hypothetical protein
MGFTSAPDKGGRGDRPKGGGKRAAAAEKARQQQQQEGTQAGSAFAVPRIPTNAATTIVELQDGTAEVFAAGHAK